MPFKPYVPEPTLREFHMDNSYFRGIMGPFGSGKSVACCIELIVRATQQAPDKDGIRWTRALVCRNTYAQLKSTTIQTFEEWVPQEYWELKAGVSPITGKLRIPLSDGTITDCTIWFMPMDKPKDVRSVLSMELTFAWLNEVREFKKSIVDAVVGRIGRFPGESYGTHLTWNGIIADTNPPQIRHWYHQLAEVKRPHNYRFFRQPGALMFNEKNELIPNPQAENVKHQQKGYDYWFDMARGLSRDQLRVQVLAEYGAIHDGKPVYDGIFNDDLHVSDKPLEVYRGLPLILGWDFGGTLNPACVVCQLTPGGQFRVLQEICGAQEPLISFVTNYVRPVMANRFSGMAKYSFGDPSASQRSAQDGRSYFDILAKLGFEARPTETNKFAKRRDAVAQFMRSTIAGERESNLLGGRPKINMAFMVDAKHCPDLVEGLISGYRFPEIRSSSAGVENYDPRPVKDHHSHVQDALQYAALGALSAIEEVTDGAFSNPFDTGIRDFKVPEFAGWDCYV